MCARPSLLDEHVERIQGSGIVVRDPGTEHAVRAQLPPVFVRMDVVWIVGPRAVVEKLSEILALFEATG